MSIRVKCEECGVALKIKDELAGHKGTCPQCKAPLQIPELTSEPAADSSAPSSPEEISEEDAIFGKGFFDADAPAPRPSKLVLSSDDDDDNAAPPKASAAPKKKAQKPSTPFTAANPGSTDNAADIAGSLLSKTGKKNRPDDFVEEDPDKVEYDLTEVKYLLTTRILPAVGAIIAAVLIYVWLSIPENNLPPLAEVTGRVTLDGAPFPAQLTFVPSDTSTIGSGALAQCNPDGTYEVYYNADSKGAVIGMNDVQISAGRLSVKETRDVVDGPNQFNFDLSSQPTSPSPAE
ncbi:MAG: RING finger protein [Planctomycetota bacterium]|jgi:hypothetical protein